jgi:hypothetical protein
MPFICYQNTRPAKITSPSSGLGSAVNSQLFLPIIYVRNQKYNKQALPFLDALEYQVDLGYWWGGGGFI